MKKARIFGTLLGILVGFGFVATTLACSTALYLQAPKIFLSLNEQIVVNVVLDTREQAVSAADLHVSFPGDILQVQSITAGTLLPLILTAGATTSNTASITLGSEPNTPFEGVGTIATITFKAIAPGRAKVSFDPTTKATVAGVSQNALNSAAPITFYVAGASDFIAPTAPTGLAATSVSASAINLSWTASTDNVGVSGYRIYRCTGTICNAGMLVGNSNTTSYSDTGLTASTSYRYRVKAVDAAGNLSAYSSSVSITSASADIPQAPGDTTAPVLSSIASSGISPTEATITWTTDEASDSQVEYGITVAYGQSTNLDASLVISHTINLVSLSSGTLYHYRTKSKDAAENLATSTDQTFITTSAPNTTPPDTTPPTDNSTSTPPVAPVTPTPTPSSSNSGGGGSSGGSSSGSRIYTPSLVTGTSTVSGGIMGCGNRTTGFSIVNGKSCAGNSGVTPTTYDFGTVTLRNGSRGPAVMELQRFLNAKLNLGLIVDGKLGPKTIAVIRQWQKNHSLVADGLVGPKTKAMMNQEAGK